LDPEDYRVIPFSRITPEACSVIAQRGQVAAEKLATWGLKRVIASRLISAVKRLKEVAATHSYGASAAEWDMTLEAIHLCTDFFQVAASLGAQPIPAVVHELAIALQGNLSGTGSARKAKEYLSQYWVGTLVTLANMQPRVISQHADTSRPDFVVDLSGLDCTIETKRPVSFHSSRDALDRAAGQLRSFGMPGVICLDLSDCIWTAGMSTAFLDSPVPIADRVMPLSQHHAEMLSDRPAKYKQSDKYARIIALVLFARVSGWRGKADPQVEGTYLVQVPTFENACSGLVSQFSATWRRTTLTAFERMSGNFPKSNW
jgi:hypothetical protein